LRTMSARSLKCCRRAGAAYYARLAETVFAHFGPEQGTRDAHFTSALAQELPNARGVAMGRGAARGGTRIAAGRLRTPLACPRSMSEAERWMERILAVDLRAREQGRPATPLTLRIKKLCRDKISVHYVFTVRYW
jgi:hypothetical protein